MAGRRLPPLNGLRAFEAAARHLSFTRAAEELHVTQTAISHQIKALEERLKVRLFRRLPRGLLLTEEGQRLLPPLRAAFDEIARATEQLTGAATGGVLTVSVLPSFAAKWLVPRLGRFRASHPEIDLRISPSSELVDFGRDDVDVGIRMGRGVYPGMHVDRLFGDHLFPVCNAQLRDGPPPLRSPADLARHTLLRSDEPNVWRLWLEAAGAADVNASRGPIFDDSSMLVQAAIDGQGIALARHSLVASDLEAGRLVKPFEITLPHDLAYYAVCPEALAEQPRIAAFRQWLLAEAEIHGGSPP